MDIFQSVILGIIQGLTEFLPISSSGHLVIFQKLLGVEHHSIAFDVAAHLGTLFTVITFYRKTTWRLIKATLNFPKYKNSAELQLIKLLVVGSVPTAIIGLSFKDQFEALFSSTKAVGVFLIITGIVLYLSRNKTKVTNGQAVEHLESVFQMKYWQAIVIGTAQGGAIAPGISRSGSTISTALLTGVDRQTAALFSFMLSLPAIFGAGILQLKDVSLAEQGVWVSLLVGFFTAYIFGLVGLWGILFFIKKGRLEFFSYYLWIVAPLVLYFL